MKKTFLNHIPVLGFVITGVLLFTSASQVIAQSTLAQAGPAYALPNEQFVAGSIAITRLEAELISLKAIMDGNPYTSFAYTQSNWKHAYYETIIELLNRNKTPSSKDIGSAIVEGLTIYDTKYVDIPPAQKLENKQTVIYLLKA